MMHCLERIGVVVVLLSLVLVPAALADFDVSGAPASPRIDGPGIVDKLEHGAKPSSFSEDQLLSAVKAKPQLVARDDVLTKISSEKLAKFINEDKTARAAFFSLRFGVDASAGKFKDILVAGSFVRVKTEGAFPTNFDPSKFRGAKVLPDGRVEFPSKLKVSGSLDVDKEGLPVVSGEIEPPKGFEGKVSGNFKIKGFVSGPVAGQEVDSSLMRGLVEFSKDGSVVFPKGGSFLQGGKKGDFLDLEFSSPTRIALSPSACSSGLSCFVLSPDGRIEARLVGGNQVTLTADERVMKGLDFSRISDDSKVFVKFSLDKGFRVTKGGIELFAEPTGWKVPLSYDDGSIVHRLSAGGSVSGCAGDCQMRIRSFKGEESIVRAQVDALRKVMPDPKKVFAVMVGAGDPPVQSPLPNVGKDVNRMELFLAQGGVPTDQKVSLVGDRATKDSVLAAVSAAARKAVESGGTLLFYDSSHGVVEDASEGTRLVMNKPGMTVEQGLDPANRNSFTISGSDLEAAIPKGVRKVIVLDTCYSGGFQVCSPNAVRIASSTGKEKSWDISTGAGGLFSYFLTRPRPGSGDLSETMVQNLQSSVKTLGSRLRPEQHARFDSTVFIDGLGGRLPAVQAARPARPGSSYSD